MSNYQRPKKPLYKVFGKLNTPQKIQDFLDKLPVNFEEKGETYRSPAEVLRVGKAHCFEGALLAAAAIYLNKLGKPLLLDLKVSNLKKDSDHVVTIFKINGLWGAISKTNHPVLGWRDPVYRSVRELALSYFHEYFLDSGEKVLISYSAPFDVIKRFGTKWIVEERDLDSIALALDRSRHFRIYPKKQKKFLRRATQAERRAAGIEIWKRNR